MTQGYIKLPKLNPMSDSRVLLRQLKDEEWQNYVFFLLLKYFKKVDKKEVLNIIDEEQKKERSQIEYGKKNIYETG